MLTVVAYTKHIIGSLEILLVQTPLDLFVKKGNEIIIP